jgi:hypothetical protein
MVAVPWGFAKLALQLGLWMFLQVCAAVVWLCGGFARLMSTFEMVPFTWAMSVISTIIQSAVDRAIANTIIIDDANDDATTDGEDGAGGSASSSSSGPTNGPYGDDPDTIDDPPFPPYSFFSDSSHDLPDEWCTHPSVSCVGSNQFYERFTCRICGARCMVPRDNRRPRGPRGRPQWP